MTEPDLTPQLSRFVLGLFVFALVVLGLSLYTAYMNIMDIPYTKWFD